MNQSRSSFAAAVGAWVRGSQKNARLVLLIAAVLSAVCAVYATKHLSVDTNSAHLFSSALPWRRAVGELDAMFPQLSDSLVVVIESRTPELAEAAQQQLAAALSARTDVLNEVFAYETEPFFRRNGLLYLDLPQLQKLASDLTRAQPFLGALQSDLSLRGLFTLLSQALERPEEATMIAAALPAIANGVEAAREGRFYRVSWSELTAPVGLSAQAGMRFIELAPKLDYASFRPAAKAIDVVRETANQLQLTPQRDVTVRLTGSVAMEDDELVSAATGAGAAFAGAMLVVIVLLYLTLRSKALVAATIVTLLFGLLTTAAFATLAVGHLNLISIAFSVLYVGLGIDYALYLCMEYRELVGRNVPQDDAMPIAACRVGGYMLICVVTTSAGFLAFVPTSFVAIAELGVIAACGMLISFIATLTLLPALLVPWRPTAEKVKLVIADDSVLSRVLRWPSAHGRILLIGGAVLLVAALALAPRVHFDPDPLNLRNPKSESVATFRRLLANPEIPTMTLSALAPNSEAAQALAAKLQPLPLVLRATTLNDFIPEEQPEKLAVIEDLSLVLGPQFGSTGREATIERRLDDRESLVKLVQVLEQFTRRPDAQAARQAELLLTQLQRFEAQMQSADSAGREQLMQSLRETLLGTLQTQLAALNESLQAGPVSAVDLPEPLVERWVSDTGLYRIEAAPREVLNDVGRMQRFVDQVRQVAPNAVGPAVVSLESGHAVVAAFRAAFVYSIVAIAVLLLALLRNAIDVLLALLPLAVAMVLTLATIVVLGMKFNFANVIALPLILGVGVDYGVYIVQRGRSGEAGSRIFQSGAARAVLSGGLITAASFASLMWSPHPGTASLGMVLALGLGLALLCALVFLPSLILLRQRGRPQTRRPT